MKSSNWFNTHYPVDFNIVMKIFLNAQNHDNICKYNMADIPTKSWLQPSLHVLRAVYILTLVNIVNRENAGWVSAAAWWEGHPCIGRHKKSK